VTNGERNRFTTKLVAVKTKVAIKIEIINNIQIIYLKIIIFKLNIKSYVTSK
jgi:hypothetical protein